MRKNGVNKEVCEISGGICAPKGFIAGGIPCNILQNPQFVSRETKYSKKNDLGLLIAEERYPAAGVFSKAGEKSAFFSITEKSLQEGFLRAVLVQGGVTNAYGETGRKNVIKMRLAVAKHATIREEDVLVVSTGAVGVRFPLQNALDGISTLIPSCGNGQEQALAFAEALGGWDEKGKSFAFSFALGDVACKIGAVCTNTTSNVCILTTDVRITQEMLDKALQSAVAQTFALSEIGGTVSPTDGVYILTSGKAGNYTISANDSEYKKFAYALKEALGKICLSIARKTETDVAFVCKVAQARSFRSASEAAKAIVRANDVKSGLKTGRFTIDSVLNAIHAAGESFDVEKIEVSLLFFDEKLVLFDCGRTIPADIKTRLQEKGEREIILHVSFKDGNYSATSIGRIL